MRKIEFNHNWICRCLNHEDEGVSVTLPHDAMITESRSDQSKGIHNIGWFDSQDYGYTKSFYISKEYSDKRVFFEIEGAYRNAEVFINGQLIGYRPYGYSDFYLEATKALILGEDNEIRIHTYNKDQPNSRWYTGTGLYRPVNMIVTEKDHILLNGIQIRTLRIDPAVIEIKIGTSAAGKIRVQILDQEKMIAEKELYTESGVALMELQIADVKYWNVETPVLYQCKVQFESRSGCMDETTESFGIRTLQWNREKGISINGERTILRGACIHHDNGIVGACAYPEAEERKIKILKENGYNAIRSAHNPCSKALLEACDRLGMLVMDEYVDAWYIHKTEYDYVNYMRQWWKTDLKEMVEKDYNHPCVIMYSTGNEVAETAQKEGIELTAEMTQYLHSLDASRPVTCGINIFFNFLSSIGFGVYSDEKAKENTKDKPVGSEFYNTLAGLLGDRVMKLGATLYPCDLKTKDAFEGMDIAGYNYGIYRYKHDLKKYTKRLILGSETFCRDAYFFWETAKKNPGIVGDFVWAGMDYIGEAGIGAWEYSDYAPVNAPKEGWLTAGSGRIDILGNPNGEALYTKVALEQTDEIFIAVKPVYQKGNHSPSAWKMTDALPSWSYRGCEGYTAAIEVYARAEKVALFLNGELIGKKRLKNTCRVIFHTKYQNGILKAIAYDKLGNVIRETQLQTASEQTKLLVQPEQFMAKPEGLIYIPLCYTDEVGIWKPMEKHELVIEVEAGKLKGFGNACSYNLQGYQKNRVSTYYGRALAVVQADTMGHALIHIKDETSEYTIKL